MGMAESAFISVLAPKSEPFPSAIWSRAPRQNRATSAGKPVDPKTAN